MKKLFLALFILLSFSYLAGQNEVSKDQLIQIKSRLETEKKMIEDSISFIEKEIKKIEAKEFESKYSTGFKAPTIMYVFGYLRKDPDYSAEELAKLNMGDSVEVLDYDARTSFFYLRYNNLYGYVQGVNVEKTDEILKLMERKNNENKLLKNAEYQQKVEQRKQELTKKFGAASAEKILTHKIWLGMTKEMAIESWGQPEDINRTVTSYSVNEQWVYGNKYLYFEDGILTSWQD